MHVSDLPRPPSGMMLVRAGCVLDYEATEALSLLLLIKPRQDATQVILQETMESSSAMPLEAFQDTHGNAFVRTMLQPGRTRFRHDGLFLVPAMPEHRSLPAVPEDTARMPVGLLPPEVLRY